MRTRAYAVRAVKNPHICTIVFPRPFSLAPDGILSFELGQPLLDEEKTEIRAEAGLRALRLSARLEEVPGLVNCAIERTSMDIGKGLAFDWPDVLPQVLAALDRYFGFRRKAPKVRYGRPRLKPPRGLALVEEITPNRSMCAFHVRSLISDHGPRERGRGEPFEEVSDSVGTFAKRIASALLRADRAHRIKIVMVDSYDVAIMLRGGRAIQPADRERVRKVLRAHGLPIEPFATVVDEPAPIVGQFLDD